MRRSFLVGLIPAVAFAAVTLASTKEAHAGPYLGVDLDLGTAFRGNTDFSWGLGGRLGYKMNIPRSYVWLLPEIGGHYMNFGTNTRSLGADHAGIVNVGGRFGLQGIVQPNIFGHVGYGILGAGYGGPETDIGAGVDFKIGPIFSLGLQVAYNAVTAVVTPSGGSTYCPGGICPSAKWVNFGLTSGFNFGEAPRRRVYVVR